MNHSFKLSDLVISLVSVDASGAAFIVDPDSDVPAEYLVAHKEGVDPTTGSAFVYEPTGNVPLNRKQSNTFMQGLTLLGLVKNGDLDAYKPGEHAVKHPNLSLPTKGIKFLNLANSEKQETLKKVDGAWVADTGKAQVKVEGARALYHDQIDRLFEGALYLGVPNFHPRNNRVGANNAGWQVAYVRACRDNLNTGIGLVHDAVEKAILEAQKSREEYGLINEAEKNGFIEEPIRAEKAVTRPVVMMKVDGQLLNIFSEECPSGRFDLFASPGNKVSTLKEAHNPNSTDEGYIDNMARFADLGFYLVTTK